LRFVRFGQQFLDGSNNSAHTPPRREELYRAKTSPHTDPNSTDTAVTSLENMVNAAFPALKRVTYPEEVDNADKEHARARLKLTVGTHRASHILAQATDHLIAGRPSRAHEISTNVLANSSPGHPCAFLDRSLCYLLLDYPSLAVTDAYRALLAANSGKYEGIGNPYAKALIGFAQAVREAPEAFSGVGF